MSKRSDLKKFTKLKWFKDYLFITIGSFLVAAGINMFLLPNKIAPGGVSGVATVLYYSYNFDVGITMLIINVPLFIIGIKELGRWFFIRTLYSTIVLSFIIDSTKFLPIITYNPLLASLFGGAIMGLGLGFVFMHGATTGGTDLVAKILHKFLPFLTLGQLVLAVDFSVIAYATITFRDYELALYAIITLFVASKVIDSILEGVNFAKTVFIISSKSENIAESIMEELDRGVTGLDGKGMYTKEYKQVIMCTLKRNEIPKLKSIVKEIDKNAFVILTDVREVLGEGFKAY